MPKSHTHTGTKVLALSVMAVLLAWTSWPFFVDSWNLMEKSGNEGGQQVQ